MTYFDYGAAAELFPGRQRSRMTGAVTYMRFDTAAEAVRYAIEVLPAKSFLGAFLEMDEERFDSNGIRRLYDSAEYPLCRLRCDSEPPAFGKTSVVVKDRSGHTQVSGTK